MDEYSAHLKFACRHCGRNTYLKDMSILRAAKVILDKQEERQQRQERPEAHEGEGKDKKDTKYKTDTNDNAANLPLLTMGPTLRPFKKLRVLGCDRVIDLD